MSETATNGVVSTILLLLGNVVSIYFLFQIVKGVYYELTKGKDDDL